MDYQIVKNDQTYEIESFVESETNEGVFYKVQAFDKDTWRCSCPANRNDSVGIDCKHIKLIKEFI